MYIPFSVSLLVDDLEVPEVSEENDVVDTDFFWEKIELQLLARGLVKGYFSSIFLTLISKKRLRITF